MDQSTKSELKEFVNALRDGSYTKESVADRLEKYIKSDGKRARFVECSSVVNIITHYSFALEDETVITFVCRDDDGSITAITNKPDASWIRIQRVPEASELLSAIGHLTKTDLYGFDPIYVDIPISVIRAMELDF